MKKDTVFIEETKKHFETLKQYVPVVARVHGEHHPEFHEVHKLFDTIVGKTKAAGADKPELDNEFERLRVITDNYKVPGDVCESYEAVYTRLARLDQAYRA